MKNKLSIIVPVYNTEIYLHQCVDSLINQTYQNIEILLIDDGSTDKCPKICDEYALQDPRVIVLHKQNQGLCAARNDGIRMATGNWLTFVDSDDWCSVDYYEQVFIKLNDRDSDVFCANGAFYEDGKFTRIKKSYRKSFLYKSRDEKNVLMEMVLLAGGKRTVTLGVPWDKIYNTDFIKKNNIQFDVGCKAWEDLLFNFEVFDKAEQVMGCSCIGYHYRLVTTSITKGFNPNKLMIGYDFLTRIHDYLGDRKIDKCMQEALNVRAIEVLANSFKAYYFHPDNKESIKIVSKQLKQIKQMPYFKQAIDSHDNRRLYWKWIGLKFVLRQSFIWPLSFAYKIKFSMR